MSNDNQELSGFAKVLADWTQQTTRLNEIAAETGDLLPEDMQLILSDMDNTTAAFEELMGIDLPLPPEKGRVLFCAAPQLCVVIGRTTGNGDARYDVKLPDGRIITVPADFIGGEDAALTAWAETRGVTRAAAEKLRPFLPSPDGKR